MGVDARRFGNRVCAARTGARYRRGGSLAADEPLDDALGRETDQPDTERKDKLIEAMISNRI